jgi:hypothetical protein
MPVISQQMVSLLSRHLLIAVGVPERDLLSVFGRRVHLWFQNP